MAEPVIGHYTSKVLEEWGTYIKKHPLGDDTRDNLLGVMCSLEQAVHYSVSKTAFPFIEHTEPESHILQGVRPPFPNMVIEYNYDYEDIGQQRPHYKNEQGFVQHAATRRIIHLLDIEELQRFVLMSIYDMSEWSDAPMSWIFSPVAIAFPYESLGSIESWHVQKGDGTYDFRFNGPGEPMTIPSNPVFEDIMEKKNIEQLKEAVRDIAQEIKMALSFLAILSCNNVETDVIAPPAKLNKARVKRGKTPIPEYRTLHLSSHTKRECATNAQHEGRASPIPHWRRGHIRNQPTAKGSYRRWMPPTVVNPDGKGTPNKPETVVT
jgi:hypothetical protein